MKFLIFFLFTLNVQAGVYLKLAPDGETVLDRSGTQDVGYTIEVPDVEMLDSQRRWKNKYDSESNSLVEMTEQEKESHPRNVAKRNKKEKDDKNELLRDKLSQYNCEAMADGFIKDLCFERKEN